MQLNYLETFHWNFKTVSNVGACKIFLLFIELYEQLQVGTFCKQINETLKVQRNY